MLLRVFSREHRRERVAQAIADPLLKLRYLRVSAASSRRNRSLLAGAALAFLSAGGWSARTERSLLERPRLPAAPPTLPARPSGIWLVETRTGQELYSNGLRIETEGAVSGRPRAYRLFAGDGSAQASSLPAGIVFHSTESDMRPLQPEENARLLNTGEVLLDYVRRHRAYHYLIDRFGRVFRVVSEGHAADHAGNSVGRAGGRICVNLNHAFLGVAFECATGSALSTPQIHSGRVLTDMLRARYNLEPASCITHAQVSVNPSNMRIGWHTDWARGFPFSQLGLPDNYEQPLASITDAGFEYDSTYLAAAGEQLWTGLHRSDEQIRASALRNGLATSAYRRQLRRRYFDFTRNPS